MVLVEFRVPLPMSVEEFQVAQLYMVVKASRENTGGGEGVEILKNEPYDNSDGKVEMSELSEVSVPKNKGQYTLKRYYIASRVPGFIAAVVPRESLVLVEEAWNAYPYCKTVITNGYLAKTKFRIVIESVHLPDRGTTENALKLTPELLAQREVVPLDIAAPVSPEAYVEAEDPTKLVSEKTGRGRLAPGWQTSHEPIMTCYKLVTADFKYWGLQTKAERSIRSQQEELFKLTLRQAFCLIDEWYGLAMEDIRRLEVEVQEELERLRTTGDRRLRLGAASS